MASKNDTVARSLILKPRLLCNDQLSPEWKVSTTDDLRVYFSNQRTRSTHWFPPPEFWMSKLGLPYAWEEAMDRENKTYYINHVTRTTTREDPRSEADQAAHPPMILSQTRRIELFRDEAIGFGFVAGSEKPVVIRSVIPNGPSHEKLFANDQILSINGEDVRDRPQVDVINLIKNAPTRIEMEVVASEDLKDARDQRDRKSSLVSRTSRQRRRSTPVSVRFADESALVQVIGPMEPVRRSSVPLIPNVLKVFLENGQTRSFRYDCNTTAEEIFRSLASKLDLQLTEYFSLVLSGPKKGQISYIQNNEKISEIYTNRNCSCVNCLCKLNIAFMPKDHFGLLSQDANVFEYLYSQVTNRVVEGFYGMDLKYDLAIKLAALQIQQKTVEAAAGRPVKVTVRQAEREFGGLGKFVPSDLLHSMRGKDLRKALEQQIKQNENLASPGEKHMSSLQCKLHYLNLAMELFSYGGRYFDVVLLDNDNDGPCLKKQTMNQHTNVTLLVNLKYGISHVVRGKVNVLCQLAEFCDVTGFTISRQEDEKKLLCIRLQDGRAIQVICSLMDCVDKIALITGYYKVYVDNTSETPLPVENDERWPFSFRRDPRANEVPHFYSTHQVIPDVWSYPSFYKTSNLKKTQLDTNPVNRRKDVFIDLSRAPPRFLENVISEESKEEAVEGVFGKDPPEDMHEFSKEKFDSSEKLNFQGDEDDVKQASPFLKISTEEVESVSSDIHVDDSAIACTSCINEELHTSVNSLNQNITTKSSQEEELGVQSSYSTSDEFLRYDPRDLPPRNLPPDAFWQIKESNCSGADKNKLEEVSTKQETFKSEVCDAEERNLNVSVGPEGHKDLKIGVVGDGGNTDLLMERFYHNSSDDEFRKSNLQKEKKAADYDDCKEASRSPDTEKGSAYDLREAFLLQHELDDNQHTNPESQVGPQFHYQEGTVMGKDTKPASTNVGVDDSICGHKIVTLAPDDVEIEMVSKDYNDQNGEPYFKEFSRHLEKRDSLKNSSNGELLQLHFEELDCDALQDSFDSTNSEVNRNLEDCDSFTNRNSPNELLQTGYSHLVNDSPSPSNDSGNSIAIVDIGSLEFDDISNTDEGPEKSDEDEPLWSSFPECFQPSKRSQDSDSIENVLLLAGESDSETENGVELIKGHELEELFTAPSQSFQFTSEVNTEFAQEDDHGSCQDTKEKYSERSFEFESDIDELSQFLTPSPSPNFSSNCLPDITLDPLLSCEVEPTALVSIITESSVTSSPCNNSYFCEGSSQATESEKTNHTDKESLILTNSMSGRLIPSTVVLVNRPCLENERITSKQFQSLSNHCREIQTSPKCNKTYSPTDWIIPSPPTQTPELQKHDIRIVSPPPSMQSCADNEFEDELTQLIIPAPPSIVDSVQLLSEIKVVSPPPTLQTSLNEIELPLCNLNDFGFISLTDDHKLAHSNDQRSNSNETEDHKIQVKTIPNDTSWASKEYEP
ncbi:uncharacterized protein [Acropora muricata]|uniref:uncharacterized protein isoform X1 n=1 Tax=Acropora muricata TaxID=159855 RepID=UPI0034E4116C